ncbi:hypothetical protein [Deinococcus hohokamensis]|uniref:Uncharacterized protein n=1 Tax=Deinococcus hohokamensis TaxID=309883 RepID=A0ABV9I714_9DEIO
MTETYELNRMKWQSLVGVAQTTYRFAVLFGVLTLIGTLLMLFARQEPNAWGRSVTLPVFPQYPAGHFAIVSGELSGGSVRMMGFSFVDGSGANADFLLRQSMWYFVYFSFFLVLAIAARSYTEGWPALTSRFLKLLVSGLLCGDFLTVVDATVIMPRIFEGVQVSGAEIQFDDIYDPTHTELLLVGAFLLWHLTR